MFFWLMSTQKQCMKLESHPFFFDKRNLTIGNLLKHTNWITSIYFKKRELHSYCQLQQWN